MGKTWVLHTATKGTGAQMVPLESVTKRSSGDDEPVFVPRDRPLLAGTEDPAPTGPKSFKIVDLMTQETLAEDATTAEAVDALKHARSIVDVNVYVWQEARDRWRRLTFGEKRAIWDLAHERDRDRSAVAGSK
jgi:hypothetical protein